MWIRHGIPLRAPSAELGISLFPVVEASQPLENEELVESCRTVGSRLCRQTGAKVRERYEINGALDSQAARVSANAPGRDV